MAPGLKRTDYSKYRAGNERWDGIKVKPRSAAEAIYPRLSAPRSDISPKLKEGVFTNASQIWPHLKKE